MRPKDSAAVVVAESDRTQSTKSVEAGEAAETRGNYADAAAAYQALAEDSDLGTAAVGHFRLGVVAWKQNRFDAALAFYRRAGELARTVGRRDLEARAENGVGAVHYARGEYAQARASYLIAMKLTDDAGLHGRFLLNLGVLANIAGDLDLALEHYLRARALFRDSADEPSEALALRNLLMLHTDRREWDDAEYASREALALLERQGDRPGIANVLRDRSEVLAARGELAEAVRHCQLAIALFTELGDQLGRAESQQLKGRFLRVLGESGDAERCLTDALKTAKHFRAKLLEAETCRQLAALKRATASVKDAARWRARAIALFRELGANREVAELERGAD